MKRTCTLMLAVLILCVLPLVAQDKGPALVFENQNKDFGKVSEGETLKHVFKFTNKGQFTLEILKVEPS